MDDREKLLARVQCIVGDTFFSVHNTSADIVGFSKTTVTVPTQRCAFFDLLLPATLAIAVGINKLKVMKIYCLISDTKLSPDLPEKSCKKQQ